MKNKFWCRYGIVAVAMFCRVITLCHSCQYDAVAAMLSVVLPPLRDGSHAGAYVWRRCMVGSKSSPGGKGLGFSHVIMILIGYE